MPRPTLMLVYEPEQACRERLLADGYTDRHALEISSYLAQSTDIQADLPDIADACTARGLDFAPVELDALASALDKYDPASTLVWTLTDGIAYFRGGAAPALARLRGFTTFGSDDSLFALCQDKFRAGAVLRAAGLPCPAAGLARDGAWLVEPPASATGWFVKPNRLGAKIGIWADSHCHTPAEALALSRRIYSAYRDDAIIQTYVEGQNVRASFLAVNRHDTIDRLGLDFVGSGSDFQTMADSMAIYGETGEMARQSGAYREPLLTPVGASLPQADAAIRSMAGRMIAALGLRDVFSLDLRVAPGLIHLIEFEVCPGLPCFDFRGYCGAEFGLNLAEAIASAALNRLAQR